MNFAYLRQYRKPLARFQEVTNQYAHEKQAVDKLLKLRDNIQSSFTASTVAKLLVVAVTQASLWVKILRKKVQEKIFYRMRRINQIERCG